MKKYFVMMILSAVAWQLAAEVIRENGRSVVYRQPDGVEVTLSRQPRRVVIAYGSLAKVWDLAGGTAVGVPELREATALPQAMRGLPKVGTATVTNVEKVLALNPDLVLLIAKLERQRSLGELLRRTGVNAVCVEYNHYGDFHALLDFFCRLNGKTIAGVPAAKKVTGEVEAITAATAGLKPVRVAIVFASATGFSLESNRTNTGKMAAMLHAENILHGDGPTRVGFSYEQLLLDDPDLILVVTMGDAEALREKFRRDFTTQPAWRELKAAKNNRVHFLPSELFLYMPGPDYPQAFRYLAGLLYPDTELPR